MAKQFIGNQQITSGKFVHYLSFEATRVNKSTRNVIQAMLINDSSKVLTSFTDVSKALYASGFRGENSGLAANSSYVFENNNSKYRLFDIYSNSSTGSNLHCKYLSETYTIEDNAIKITNDSGPTNISSILFAADTVVAL